MKLLKGINLLLLVCTILLLVALIISLSLLKKDVTLKASATPINSFPVPTSTYTEKASGTSITKSPNDVKKTPSNSSKGNDGIESILNGLSSIINKTSESFNNNNNSTPNTNTSTPFAHTNTPSPSQSNQITSPNFVTAYANDPIIDGIISTDEYIKTYTLDASNSSKWTSTAGICPTVNYYFAWSDKGLYIAVKSSDLAAGDQISINLNPNKLIPTGGAGVFFSFSINANSTIKVNRHNYQPVSVTTNRDGIPGGYDISSKVISKVVINNGINLELLIPIAEIQVKSTVKQFAPNLIDATNLTINESDVWGLGTYVIKREGTTWNAWTSLLGPGKTPTQVAYNAFNVKNLGTITFLSHP